MFECEHLLSGRIGIDCVFCKGIMVEKGLQKQFEGYAKTPLLWKGELLDLKQFEFNNRIDTAFDGIIEKKLRLGHLVERFISFQFQKDSAINVILESLQVFDGKRTIGEFDFLIEHDSIQYHIEVVYKFYLFDVTVGETEVEHCIGPNRKDSLLQKIDKLKKKQFPLKHAPEAIDFLVDFDIDHFGLVQQVYFKGKIFIPHGEEVCFKQLNSESIAGFYIPFNQLVKFDSYSIYIPIKHDWLVEPHKNVDWVSFKEAKDSISIMIEEQRSPLVWFKNDFDEVSCGFVTWW